MLDVTSTPVEPDALPIVSRADAIKAGLLRYCTGDPCIHGHRAERWVSSCHCCQCDRGSADYKGGPASTWTPSEDDVLRAQWGKSPARDIAALLKRSRNSVISRAHRIGLGESYYIPGRGHMPRPRRPRAAAPSVTRERNTFGGMFTKFANAKRKQVPAPWTPEARILRPQPVIAPKISTGAIPASTIAGRFQCETMDLRDNSCRWPVTEGSPWIFCGIPSADLAADRPYCVMHSAIAYQPARWRP